MQITRNRIETASGVDDEGNAATWGNHVTDEEYAAAPQIDEVEA